MGNYIKNANTVSVAAEGSMEVYKKLPTATYTINMIPMQPITLNEVESFNVPSKLYGDIEAMTDRIINTFKERTVNTGVLLDGLKGSGKTLLAKNISVKLLAEGIPTIIVNYNQICPAAMEFLETIDSEVVVLFDEIDKVYNSDNDNNDSTNCMLSLLDGLSNHKKLFLLTSNEYSRINDYFKDRPGRIYYKIHFDGLNREFVEQYAEDNLLNSDHLEELITITDNIPRLSFDILASFIEEINRYNSKPREALRYLNVSVDLTKTCCYKVYDQTGNEISLAYPADTVYVNIASDSGYRIYFNAPTASGCESIYVDFTRFTKYSKTRIEYEVDGYTVVFEPAQVKRLDKESLLDFIF